MFVCRDCYAVCEGQEKHPESPACNDFDGQEEEMQQDVYGDDVYTIVDAEREIKELKDIVSGLHAEFMEVARQFDTIIAAVVKAAGPEEER